MLRRAMQRSVKFSGCSLSSSWRSDEQHNGKHIVIIVQYLELKPKNDEKKKKHLQYKTYLKYKCVCIYLQMKMLYVSVTILAAA